MFEFDPAKASANFEKHGITFADAVAVLFDPRACTSDRSVGGELRHITTGMDEFGRVITVVWTKRGHRYRLISARAARREERILYAT